MGRKLGADLTGGMGRQSERRRLTLEKDEEPEAYADGKASPRTDSVPGLGGGLVVVAVIVASHRSLITYRPGAGAGAGLGAGDEGRALGGRSRQGGALTAVGADVTALTRAG